MAQSFEVFLSYARVDQELGDEDSRADSTFVTRLASEMERVFRLLTGQPLRIFLDVAEIETAQMWEERIMRALDSSSLMVALLTPSYFTSVWCMQEWSRFEAREARLREAGTLGASDALIFPVLYQDLNKVLDPEARQRVGAAMKRQYRDLRLSNPASAQFRGAVRTLVENVIDALLRLEELAVPAVAVPADLPPQPEAPSAETAPVAQPAIGSQRIRTRIGDREAFVEQLSRAERAIVVGLTNAGLGGFLEEALKRKRRLRGGGAFWSTIEVVFAGEPALRLVHDELNVETPDVEEATLHRLDKAERSRASIATVLRRANRPHQWRLYEYPHLPPFVGAMLDMPDGSRLIQVATLRPGWSTSEYMFMEFFEMAGEVAYYQGAFDDIRRRSREVEEILLVGVPHHAGHGFVCQAQRYRRAAMTEGREPTAWLPVVLVCTYTDDRVGARPILQFRTRRYADRELGRLSHISGYVYQRDCEEALQGAAGFLLPEAAARNAATRRLRATLHDVWDLRPVGQLQYHSSNTDSLYFYVFDAKLPPSYQLPPESHLQHWSLGELLRLREYQVLSQAHQLLDRKLPPEPLAFAFHATGLNLILHQHGELGRRLVQIARDGNPPGRDAGEILEEVKRLRVKVAPERYLPGEDRPVQGLSGLQFREFFSWLLPFYASIGVPGAEEALTQVRGRAETADAADQLTRLYGNGSVMRRLSLGE